MYIQLKAFKSVRDGETCHLAKATKWPFPGHFAVPNVAAQVWLFDVKGKLGVRISISSRHSKVYLSNTLSESLGL